jgi:V8-like Glu-specific endopeptidase
LSRTQAVGTDFQLESAVGLYNNEPIQNYDRDSVFAKIGRSVGRLDVLTDKGNFPCTAFIVSKKYILTNYHCSFGMLDNERLGATRIDAVQFVAGYTQTGIDEGTRRYTVTPTPVEFNAELDYAVLEVLGNPSQEYGELKLASLVPNDRAPFWIIGHPRGEGQRISREKCRASAPAVNKNKLLHTCDTLPGNSGSPVIDAGLQVVVALHHAGIANDSVNAAILMSKILENSSVLAAYRAPDDLPKAEPKTAAIDVCDALYSAATEAKACFAYEAYADSCSDHSLAPIAGSYIKKFCQPQETVEVEKTCDDDPSLCNTDQLCGQSLTFISGKAGWRTDNVSYVAEAKRRGLTCGVTEAVAQPKKTCSEDATVCNKDHLCKKATWKSNSGPVWDTHQKVANHVTEAKRRGLSCGVVDVVAKAKVEETTCSANATLCNEDDLCMEATHSSTVGQVWETNKSVAGHVTEAKRRGLSCGVDTTAAIKTAFKNQTVLKRKQIQYALKKLNYYRSSIDALYGPGTEKALVNYAKSKGLNINNPEKIFKSVLKQVSVPSSFKSVLKQVSVPSSFKTAAGNCNSLTPEACNRVEICNLATFASGNSRTWLWDKQPGVKEAKKRGLTCGVK